VGINGGRSQVGLSGNLPTFQSPGLTFALPTNIGITSRNEFAVIPEFQLQVSYDFTPNLRAFAGYNYLYWSEVVRPGDQIDRVVNASQRQGGVLLGAARPQPRFESTDFWAQGLNVGMQVRY
jgi:hypothetical protein